MARSPLLALAEQADLFELLLRQLPPQALAVLATTSRGVRAALQQQPEAVWQHSAQLAGYGSTHPVFAALRVQDYLRQQQQVHSNLAAGRCRQHLREARGFASSDGARLVSLELAAQAQLCVTGLHDSDEPLR